MMEKPLDGGLVDLEGFNTIIMGDDHQALVEKVCICVVCVCVRARSVYDLPKYKCV